MKLLIQKIKLKEMIVLYQLQKSKKIQVCGFLLKALKKKADIVISAGNTGALLVISKLNLK